MSAILLISALLAPLAAALVIPWPCSKMIRGILSVAAPLLSFICLAALYPALAADGRLDFFAAGFGSSLGFSLGLDILGFLLALIATLVWALAALFAQEYLAGEEGQTRFNSFLNLTLVGTLGVFVAGDLLTLLLFFELMTLASYVLVVHNQDTRALGAGRLYLFLGVLSGLLLLLGIAILGAAGEGLSLFPDHGILPASAPGLHLLVAGLLILGFGIKAGMVPLHIWLPEAHPVAPTPASALLSGIMIKAGAYGIFRTIALFFPWSGTEWITAQTLGLIIIVLGTATMFTGGLLALIQTNIKRLLACSSISQMGYILVGIGAAAYLAGEGALGLGGWSYHVLNHALFKSSLFLVAGVIYLRTQALELQQLGGLWRRLPLTFGVAVLAGLGITGFPGLNGYASKTILHHALTLAAEHGPPALQIAETLFVITGGITVCYMLKFLLGIFMGPPTQYTRTVTREGWPSKLALGILAAALLFIGLLPRVILEKLILPTVSSFPYTEQAHLAHLDFFAPANLQATAVSLALGLALFGLGSRLKLFSLQPPAWLSIHYLFQVMGRGLLQAGLSIWQWVNGAESALAVFQNRLKKRLLLGLSRMDGHPGQSPFFNQICIFNMDFDVMVILFLLAAVFMLYSPSIILAGGL